MIGRFTQRGDRTLFLFVFATGGKTLPATLDEQKTQLLDAYRDRKWECREILSELRCEPELYFDDVGQIRMQRWTTGCIALIGDGAFCVSLLAGQGTALAIVAAYVLAGELARADNRHDVAFANYEALLRDYIRNKQQGAVRFAAAFAPKTERGMFRNQMIRAFGISGVSWFAVGRDIVDRLTLPPYHWPSQQRRPS